jgi:hypothetical protein
MKANYKARVVYDENREAYIVERKRHWWDRWVFVQSHSFNSYTPKETAKRSAIEACEALVAQVVVYETRGETK